MLEDINKHEIFGKVISFISVIEFQKRGLPHAHILIILDPKDKIRTTDDYDRVISAEIPDKEKHQYAYETVVKHHFHGPCGMKINQNASCMENKSCSKNYPRNFQKNTTEDENGYPKYRRRDNGSFVMKGKHRLDNRWVVPYNLFLATKYDSHINVEICSTVKAVKYLYKYVYKGHDKIIYAIQSDDIKGN